MDRARSVRWRELLSLNADLARDDVAKAQQVMSELKQRLLKDGLDPQTFTRLKNAAVARQAWAVQGNSALADYYWSALGDYDGGRFADPSKRLQAVTLEQFQQRVAPIVCQARLCAYRKTAVQL